jgi:hypothetical protein
MCVFSISTEISLSASIVRNDDALHDFRPETHMTAYLSRQQLEGDQIIEPCLLITLGTLWDIRPQDTSSSRRYSLPKRE